MQNFEFCDTDEYTCLSATVWDLSVLFIELLANETCTQAFVYRSPLLFVTLKDF